MGLLLGNPYLLGGLLVALLASHTGAYWWGHRAAAKTCAIERAEAQAASQAQKEVELGKAIVAATHLEVARAKTRVEFRTLTEQVEKVVATPVYRDRCLDADGLRLANAALAGTRPAASQPHSAVPDAHSAIGGVGSGDPAEVGRSGRTIP